MMGPLEITRTVPLIDVKLANSKTSSIVLPQRAKNVHKIPRTLQNLKSFNLKLF